MQAQAAQSPQLHELPRGIGHRFLQNHFTITDEEMREENRVSIAVGDSQWDDYQLQVVSRDCALFAREILSGPAERPYNGHFLLGPHHLEWSELVRKYMRICVMASRDHGKTFFFDFAFPIWRAVLRPGGSGFIFSATQDQAVRILADIKQELETNPKLQYLVPDTSQGGKGKKWSSTAIQLTNGHRIYARGFGTRVRGAHPDWIVVDDALNDETAYSEVTRKKQIEYFYTAVSNMVTPGGIIIVVGTPFHQADLYADLAGNEEYIFKRYQALNGPEELPLWPARYDKLRLEKKRKEIGTIRFTREFQCEPVADDMSLFPLALFKGQPTEVFTLTLGMPKEIYDRLGVTIYMGVDFAMSSSAQADYTVIWAMGLDKWGNRWIVDIQRGKGLPYQTQLSMINEMGHKYDPALVFLEANQMQRIFGDELIRTTDLPIKQFVTGAQKNTLDKGVPSLRVLLENGKFRIPRGDKRSIEITNLWIEEMRAFTWVEGALKSVGTHDDTVMACIGPGALVTTYSGKKPIEQVAQGDLVLTHAGNWRAVTATMRRDYLGKAYQFRASGGRAFVITDEHPVWTAHPMRDTVANNQRLLPDPATWSFRKAAEVRAGRKMAGDYTLLPTPHWQARDGQLGLDLAEFVSFATHARGGNCWKKDEQSLWWRADRKVPRHLKIDEEFGFLLGLYLAEGSTSGHQTHLALHRRETYIQDFVMRMACERFNALGGESVTGNGRVVWVSSIPAARLFRQFGSGREKGLPIAWMGLPLPVRMAIVRGWLVGDGCLGRRKGSEAHVYLKAVTISQPLLSQMVWTLREAGFAPSIHDFSNEKPAWCLTLSASDTTRLLGDMNAVERQRWATFQPTERQTPTNSRSVAQPIGIAVRVAECAEMEYEGPVFNLQVEGDESYVVEDVAVHNCWICDQAIRAGGFSFDFGDDVSSNGNLDKMLQDENSETVGTDAVVVETGIEERLRMALGDPTEAAKAAGNLIDDDEDRILGPMEPEPAPNQRASGNLVDDADEDEEAAKRRLLGGAPSPSKMRSYW